MTESNSFPLFGSCDNGGRKRIYWGVWQQKQYLNLIVIISSQKVSKALFFVTTYPSKASFGLDHIQEVLNKWEQIDDEIWAKIICMERNRRVAKAYARTPVLTVNGSADGFDGYK
ncbi:dwarfin sma-2 [Trichonephila clavata]|uniref:Dwarfin sma-2 n=1 Tax=Trichonephila clavata TaxID=2740835 RepID=A0A8X6GGV2_TRICU|nr:dwarfin sma-2 [Trichonephila clavata]